jgi:hypothetical protein
MNSVRWPKIAGIIFILLGLLRPVNSLAQMPSLTDPYLDSWSFNDPTNWTSDMGYMPIAFTNIDNVSCWATNDALLGDHALLLDSTNPAYLNYNVVETNGYTNLIFSAGTLWFWFSPDWTSANQGGTGPGNWGEFIDAGAWTTNAAYGWWSLYVSPGGDTIYFSGQTNGMDTNYLSYPISWTNQSWHLIGLSYTATNSILYVDGQQATNGIGVTYWPRSDVLTNGFYIGSDYSGTEQARGEFVDVETYSDYSEQEYSNFFSYYYNSMSPYLYGASVPSGGSSNSISASPAFSIPSGISMTNLWLAITNLATNNTAGLYVSNTLADVLYEIQSTTNLAKVAQTGWTSQGFFNGPELTNWMSATVLASKQGSLFLRIRSWVDSTGTGIPDWWWLQYFGQDTNVNAYATDPAGDGFTDLQKSQMGLNPNIYYNPNGPPGFFGSLDATGTNAFLYWSNAPGPVINYSIQRGIQDTNGNYTYSQIGLVSSNANFFEDVGAITNANAQNDTYHLEAVYSGSSLSATDSWTVWWYPNDGSYGPPYGPPPLSNFWANADATGTNILLSWTPAQGSATNYIILHGIYNATNSAWNYTQITNLIPGTTNLEIFGAITNSANWTDIYEAEAVYPGGGLSFPASSFPGWPAYISINVGANTNGPAAPGNFYGYPDPTGTNIFLTWSPVSGSVTNYIIYGGVLDGNTQLVIYHQLGKVGAGTNSFEVVGGIDGSGNNLYYIFNVVAVYTNRSLSQSASWLATSGASAPGALSAYLDSTGTNVLLAWTPATGAVTGYLVQRSDDYGSDYYPIGTVNSNTFSFEDVAAVNDGYFGFDYTVYEVQATFPNGGLSPAVTSYVATNFPAPSSLSATVDSTGTNVLLSWTAAVGTVSDYVILRGTYNSSTGNYSYSTIATVGAGTTSYEDVGADTGGNANNDIYEAAAVYPGGGSSSPISSAITQSSTPPTYNLNVTAQMVRNQAGRWQLMFSSIPATVQKIAFYWYFYDYFEDFGSIPDTTDFDSNGQPLTTENDIPVSSITNGVYVLPDFLMTNWFANNSFGKVAMIQPIGTNNQYGVLSQAGFQPYDSPVFVDGRQHLKQNLLFKLRGATISQPVTLTEDNVWDDPFFFNLSIPADTNYVESSFFHSSYQAKTYAPGFGGYYYMKMDNIWPFTANYELHGSLYDTNFSGPSFSWQPNASAAFPAGIAFQGTLATVPATAVLGIADPYWISQGLGNLADVAAYTNSGNLYLQSGFHNLFGLSFAAALVDTPGYHLNMLGQIENASLTTLAPGSSVSEANASTFYSQTADPSLLLTNYYFAPVNTPGTAMPGVYPAQLYPLPSDTGFANTNQTPLIITTVGTPTVIGGWAKFSILNGSSSKFAYLGQYFVTNAYVVTNGIVTTNTTGIVSPYGDFFPTAPGAIAMITMPDINTGQQGTGVVRVVALNVDANHDGTMDFTYQGPDFVSSSKPFRFWANDDQDSGDDGGNDGVPGVQPFYTADGFNSSGLAPVANPAPNEPVFQAVYPVHGTRDLVDFFPVYINIGSLFQSNVWSAGISFTDTNYQFVLSQADGVLRFVYTDLTPTNYMNYLQNITEATNLASAITTTITSGGVALPQSFVGGIATNDQGVILVEAAAPTTQPLVLSIYHGSNLLAQTSLYLSVSGVEQMFRSKTLLLNPDSRAKADRLTDASVPNEPDTTGKNFIFVHGYNVNPDQARGNASDIYKRLYWSGSHAKFYAVTWEGADTQGSLIPNVTSDYHSNVFNAFNTAPLLNTFLNSLSGTNIVAAHSLGNMLVLSTLNDYTNQSINTYFMIDAAVPIEALGGIGTNENLVMTHSDWTDGATNLWGTGYGTNLWASYWCKLFPTNDYRSQLTWNNRLAAGLENANVYNFYSSGEEVLRTFPTRPTPSFAGIAANQVFQTVWNGKPIGSYVWCYQELLKGRMPFDVLGSTHGGWGFNTYYTTYVGSTPFYISPTNAAQLGVATLKTNPVFDVTFDTPLFGASGSTYAQAHYNRILSDAIPALTLPAGANPVSILGVTHNFDMKTELENGWPQGRLQNLTEGNNWWHSDFHQVAYTYTYLLFNKMVTLGNLK